MSEEENEGSVGEVSEFTEQEVLDSVAILCIEGLLEFIEVFYFENGEFNTSPPRDEKLKDILGHIPVEIALVWSWFGEQLLEWEKSLPKERTSDLRSAMILASSLTMLCLQFIRVCKTEAEKERKDQQSCAEEQSKSSSPEQSKSSSPEQSKSSSPEQSKSSSPETSRKPTMDQSAQESVIIDFEWKTYRFLPCNETLSNKYLTYESVQKILEDLVSYCKDQEKFIMENLYKEMSSSNSEHSLTIGSQSPSEENKLSESSENPSVSNDGEEVFNNLLKTIVSIFSNTENSQINSPVTTRPLSRLAYAKAKRQPPDNKEVLTLLIESKTSKTVATPSGTNVTENVLHSAESSGVPDNSTATEGEDDLGIRVYTVYEVKSVHHLLLAVPPDHAFEWGNESEAPAELLVLIKLQNCASETWEMMSEAEISDASPDFNKAYIKGVFNSLYKNLEVLKAGTILRKSPNDINVALFHRGLLLKTKTVFESSESESGDELPKKCSRTMLSHKYGIRKGNMSLIKSFPMEVRKEDDRLQIIVEVPLGVDTSTTASEADSAEEAEQIPKGQP